MDVDDLNGSLHDVINGAVGIEVVEAEQDAPVPAEPYITFKAKSFVKVGKSRGETTVAAGQPIHITYEFTLAVQVFGTNSFTYATKLANNIELDSIKKILYDNNLVAVDVLSMNDISTFLSERWDNRSQIDLLMRTTETLQDGVSTVESLQYSYEVKDAAGDTVVSGSDTIT